MGDLRRVTPISPVFGLDRGTPVDRYYIESFLARHGEDILGAVLEIGDDAYTRRFGGASVTRSEILNVEPGDDRTTIVADLAEGDGIPSDSFDCVIVTQTLELIYDVRAAVGTLHRILKPGGVLLASAPGITQTTGDVWAGRRYWRFTRLSVRRLLEEVFAPDSIEVETRGNVLAAVAFLHGVAADELRPEELESIDAGYDVSILVRAVKT
jgi:SAM-dependent methyltransferase